MKDVRIPPATLSPEPRLDDPLWTLEDLAAYFQVPLGTVRRWRHDRTGPQTVRVGNHVRARPHRVRQYLDELEQQERDEQTGRRPA